MSADQLPRYGDPDWQALEFDDPRRMGAVYVAAEAWRRHCSREQVVADLEFELVLWRQVFEQREAEWLEFAAWPEVAEQVQRHARWSDRDQLLLLRYGPGVASHD